MPHVSKQVLQKDTKTRLSRQFIRLFSSLNEKQSRALLTELLTQTERIMLAKRIALIFMLQENYSYYHIQKTLGISTSTAKRFKEQVRSGMYSALMLPARSNVQPKKMLELLMEGLEIARMGMPTRNGPRWSPVIDRKKKK